MSAEKQNNPVVGISIGDINGIGPEVTLKVLSNPDMLDYCTPVIFASANLVQSYKKMLKDLNFSFNSISKFTELKYNKINVFNCWQEDVQINPGQENATGGKYAVRSLEVAVQCLKSGEIDTLVTAPISKHNTHSNNFTHAGHTPYLKETFGADDVAMILFTDRLRVSPLTEHIALKDVSGYITKDHLTRRLNTLLESLRKDFALDKPKIAVLGLNPHNSDRGLYGKEEEEIIYPVIESFRAKDELVVGPFAADSYFARQKYEKFDLCLGMYHDQVLIPFKLMDENQGVNFTAGLEYVRTSPDHGTGFDIAGKDIADPSSMRAAIFSSIDIYHQRQEYLHYTANPLKVTERRSSRG